MKFAYSWLKNLCVAYLNPFIVGIKMAANNYEIEQMLLHAFVGNLKSIYIRRDGTGSQSRGGGFLTFVGRSQ